MQKVVYIGTSLTIAEKIESSKNFLLTAIICEAKRIQEAHKDNASNLNLPLLSFKNREEFTALIEKFSSDHIFIIYQLDMIVPGKLTKAYRFFNLHAGNIATNRGAHPIIRTVLNGDDKTELTLHEINAKIDQGIIVSTFPVDVTEDDTPISIKSEMERGIPKLLNELLMFLKEELQGKEAKGGTYYKPIQVADFTIDIYQDSQEEIRNKIRSQAQYNGGVVLYNEQKYFATALENWEEEVNTEISVQVSKTHILVKRYTEAFNLKIREV